MQDRGCSPMSPSGMDDSEQDGLLASGEYTPLPFLSTFAGQTFLSPSLVSQLVS